MATIADIIGGSKSDELNECALYIQIVRVMKCNVDNVRKAISTYGVGHIYTPCLILPDTPKNRTKLTEMYGEVVIILSDGTVMFRDRSCAGMMNRRKHRIEAQIEKRKFHKERDERRVKRATERMFADGQGRPSPKRQGQCRGIQCVYHPKTSYDQVIPKKQDVFVTIHIKY